MDLVAAGPGFGVLAYGGPPQSPMTLPAAAAAFSLDGYIGYGRTPYGYGAYGAFSEGAESGGSEVNYVIFARRTGRR